MKKEITSDELFKLATDYSKKENVEVFTDIDVSEKGFILDINQGFIDYFEENYTCDLTLAVEKMFQALVNRYTEVIQEGK